MNWRDQPLYVVEWAGGDRLPYTKKIYTSLTWAKKYLFEYMQKNLAEGYIQLHQPHGVGNIISIARQEHEGLAEVEVWEDDQVVDVHEMYLQRKGPTKRLMERLKTHGKEAL